MAFDNEMFSRYKETRALAGYKSAWLVKLPNKTKFSLIGATESVPYVFGDKGTFDFNLLQSGAIGKVEDKMSMEKQDINVLHHRDNAFRYEKLKGKILEFMSINPEFVGYKFVGTLDYRPNNAEADINRATVTITPMDGSVTPVFNARPQIEETLIFSASIPATIKIGDKIDLSPIQNVTVVPSAVIITDEPYTETPVTNEMNSSNIKEVSFTTSGLYAITITAEGYSSWTTTVYVE